MSQIFPALATVNPYTGKMDKSPTDYQGGSRASPKPLYGTLACIPMLEKFYRPVLVFSREFDEQAGMPVFQVTRIGLQFQGMCAGPRSAKAIADSALALLPDTFITILKGAAAFDKFKGASETPKVILASTKPRATPLYKSLSLAFRGRLAFALVQSHSNPHHVRLKQYTCALMPLLM